MNLLKISETNIKTKKEYSVGIDLGTTNSLIASVINNKPKILFDKEGYYLIPSVVQYLKNKRHYTGNEAKKNSIIDPSNTISSIKRIIGRNKINKADPLNLLYNLVNISGMLCINTIDGIKNPIEISSIILSALKKRAENIFGSKLINAVITVPAYFDAAQRQATKDAAYLAKINVLRLLNEPTAAAIAYGINNSKEGIYIVYDLGGGTFDLSVLKITNGIFKVLATGGDTSLGGDDFDYEIFKYILIQSNIDIKTLNANDIRMLLNFSQKIKEKLSSLLKVQLKTVLSNNREINLFIEQSTFILLTNKIVQYTIHLTNQVIKNSNINFNDIDGIILVGGSTKMPIIYNSINKLFKKKIISNIEPDQVVAIGAAIHANLLSGNNFNKNLLLLDVTPLSLGIETIGGLVEKIILRNSTIPIICNKNFTTFKNGQTAISIHIVQGEQELAKNCRSLAHFELRGIPVMGAGVPIISVTFTINENGLLSVSAIEKNSNIKASIIVKPTYGLSDKDIEKMLIKQ